MEPRFRHPATRGASFLGPNPGLFFQSPWFCSLVRILLGGVFAIAGCAKLAAPRAFARIISAYGLVPEEFLVPVAVGLPAVELLAGLGLLFNIPGKPYSRLRASDVLSFRFGIRDPGKSRHRLRLFFADGNPCKKQPSCGFSEGPGI